MEITESKSKHPLGHPWRGDPLGEDNHPHAHICALPLWYHLPTHTTTIHLAIRGVEVPWGIFYTERNYLHTHTYTRFRSCTTPVLTHTLLLFFIWRGLV